MRADPKLGAKVMNEWDSPRRRELIHNRSIDVWYAQLQRGDRLVPDQGLELFRYTSKHSATNGKPEFREVVCYSKEDFLKLLAVWNAADGWHYEAV